jgi:precorrin-2 dehydrogenase/sirohydrochlorin ferrochelatase
LVGIFKGDEMSYFPAFIKLKNVKVLIVGGGKIATEKLQRMLDFTKEVSVLAPDLSSLMQKLITENSLDYMNKIYHKGDIDGFGIVIVAVDDIKVQEQVYNESREKGILCNSVDSVNYCDFIFPSYIKNGDLTIAVSTSGASPAVAKQLRIFLENIIPSSISQFLFEMKNLRKSMPKGKERMVLLEKKAKDYFQNIKKL